MALGEALSGLQLAADELFAQRPVGLIGERWAGREGLLALRAHNGTSSSSGAYCWPSCMSPSPKSSAANGESRSTPAPSAPVAAMYLISCTQPTFPRLCQRAVAICYCEHM